MAEGTAYSFELSTELMDIIGKEFDVEKQVARFAEAVKGKSPEETEKIGKQMFTEYGREWMRRTLQLGEEYTDRTYEVMKQAIDKAGGYYKFALVPQRFLEIAYLSTQDFATLPVLENNAYRLMYRLPDCKLYKSMKQQCADAVVQMLPCKNACLTALEVVHKDLDIDAVTGMDADMNKDGYCQFYAKRA